MTMVIKDLFFGKIRPGEKLAPVDNPELNALTKRIDNDREYFRGVLSAEDFTRFDGYGVSNDLIADIFCAEAFTRGFRLAVTVIAEVYQNQGAPPDIWKLLGMDKPNT